MCLWSHFFASQTSASPHPATPHQHGVSYADMAMQMGNLSLSHRHPESAEEDSASTDSYSTTPTPPPGSQIEMQHQMMMPGSPYVVIPHRQMMSGQVYQSPMPMQYIPSQGYPPYSPYTQYVTVPDAGSRYPQSQTPPVQQRSPSPVMVGTPYVTNPPHMQSHMGRPGPGQTPPFTRTPPPASGQYIRNTMPGSVPTGAMMFPVPQSPSTPTGAAAPAASVTPPVTSAAYPHWKGLPPKRGGKSTNGMSHDMLHYQALAQEGHRVQQNIASLSGHSRQPVVKMIPVSPHFPIMSGQR